MASAVLIAVWARSDNTLWSGICADELGAGAQFPDPALLGCCRAISAITSAILATKNVVEANRVKDDGAAHGVDRAPGLHQRAIAGGLDDAAAVAGDGGVYQVSSVPTQRMSVPASSAPISRL